jgi:hypothetical protein
MTLDQRILIRSMWQGKRDSEYKTTAAALYPWMHAGRGKRPESMNHLSSVSRVLSNSLRVRAGAAEPINKANGQVPEGLGGWPGTGDASTRRAGLSVRVIAWTVGVWIAVGLAGRVVSVRAESTSIVPEAAVIAAINEEIRQGWADEQLEPSPAATEREFCRRLFLDVLGRIPRPQELAEYLGDKQPDRRRRLVERLLYDSRYSAEYAIHWSTVWANLLIGRADDDDQRLVSRRGLETYLRESFAANLPYDGFVHELVAAAGTNEPDSPDFNGAVNFLSGKLADDAIQATSQTARLFLGLQVQCTQCHNHPFNEWKQSQFWQFNSFFRQAVALRRYEPGSREVSFVELTDQDFPGEDRPPEVETARVYYELRNGQLEAAYPVFIDGTPIDTSGYVRAVNRREQLADLIVASPEFSRAAVNRAWAHFLGHGFTQPVDDMGPHNPAVYSALLESLAEHFRACGYDLKQLIVWIVMSEPYGLSSRRTANNEKDDPSQGPPRYSHFYMRQMTPEQLYRSLRVASQTDTTPVLLEAQDEAQRRWLRQFTIALGTDEGDETTTFNGSITQTLMMFNGELMQEATQAEPSSFLRRLASNQRLRTAAKLHRLFLAAVARRAAAPDVRTFRRLEAYHGGDQLKALQDMWWALLNSNEFILNH